MASPNEISPQQLFRLIGTASAPTVVDVCIDSDFAKDPRLIPGSFRHPHTDISVLLARLGNGPVVVTCQKGKKLSQGVAAILRSHGVQAEFLSGGILGWRDFGAPLVPVSALPSLIDGSTLWVTRHRPKIDRIACPWLIRRFIDPAARFLFVTPSEVLDVADRFGATPFDVENVFWSHREASCTFDTMLKVFQLETGALKKLATVVRAADTNTHTLAPEAAGLLAFSVGLSRMYRDDMEQLDAGMIIYDALYRWARDGAGETHDWPNNQGPRG